MTHAQPAGMTRRGLMQAGAGAAAFAALGAAAPARAATLVTPGIGRIDHTDDWPSRWAKPRHVSVWLPPSYDGKTPHSLLVMHDGQNLFEPGRAFGGKEWGIDETLARLISEQTARPTIVAGVWNTDLRRREYMPAPANAALPADLRAQQDKDFGGPPLSAGYLRFLVRELLPVLRRRYVTRPGPEETFLMGSSMGGLISLYGLCAHPRTFGGAGCLSIHWPARTTGYDKGFGPDGLDGARMVSAWQAWLGKALPRPGSAKLWLDRGDLELDAHYQPYQEAMDPFFAARGWTDPATFQSRVYPGTNHSEGAWAARVAQPLTFLLGRA